MYVDLMVIELMVPFGLSFASPSYSLLALLEALFTSNILKEIEGDYFEPRKFSSSLFTTPGIDRIIPRYPYKSSLFLVYVCLY
jgi:hypothetical protein